MAVEPLVVEIIGIPETEAKLNRLRIATSAKVIDVVAETALKIRNNAVKSISQPGTGRTYIRRGVAHTASAPGQPPATDTGRLKTSLGIRFALGGLSAEIYANANYACALEFGTSKMAPRPFLNPAFEKEKLGYIAKLREILIKPPA